MPPAAARRARAARARRCETEWVLPTSGTSGPPKLVVHTLATLTGAIAPAPLQQWATFYDIRRYGGLQIFLRALAGRGSLRLSGAERERSTRFLARLGEAGVTHISGTPSHWRKALMSGEAAPHRSRLCAAFRRDRRRRGARGACAQLIRSARIEHAYASTEAGVAFAVDDGKAGFPAALARSATGRSRCSVVDGALQCAVRPRARCVSSAPDAPRSPTRTASSTPATWSSGAAIAIISSAGAAASSMSAAPRCIRRRSRRCSTRIPRCARAACSRASNPITGALVVAEVVLTTPARGSQVALEREILAACRSAPARAHDAGAAALRRRSADDRRRKAARAMDNVIVTGASRGLGLAIAERLAADGFHVIAVARATARRSTAASRARARRARVSRLRSRRHRRDPRVRARAQGASSGRSTGSSTTPGSAPRACSPTCPTPTSRR